MSWFEKLLGFSEENPDQVRANLVLEGPILRSKENGKEYCCGTLEMPSLGELRQRTAELRGGGDPLLVEELIGDVQQLHQSPACDGALFQVASQFNLLEMVGPWVTPEHGVGIYENDRTQGPACAIACGAATVVRNYFADVGGQVGQSADRQIDCLCDLGGALGNAGGSLWAMQNGYALASAEGLQAVGAELGQSGEGAVDTLRSKLRIGVQREAGVTLGGSSNIVTQAFCSAVPVAYSQVSADLWEPLARLILEAAYEATLQVTLGGRVVPVVAGAAPEEVLEHRTFTGNTGQRSQMASNDTDGGYLIGDTASSSMIDILRAQSLVTELGATMISGLQGNYSEPKLESGVGASWLAEGESVTSSSPTWGSVRMSPRRIVSQVEFTDLMEVNSSANIEQRLRTIIMAQLAQAIDIASLTGSGGGPEPLGLFNTPGINEVELGTDGGSLTYSDLIDIEGEIDASEAMLGAPAWLTNSAVKKALRTTLREPTNGSDYIFEPDPGDRRFGNVAGYKCGVSNNVPSTLEKGSSGETLSAILIGCFNQLLIGGWGGSE